MTTNGNYQIFLYNRLTNVTTLITNGTSGIGGNGYSINPSISGDGKYITFTSNATDLIPGLTTNGQYQIYLYSRGTGLTTLVTNGTSGIGGSSSSSDAAINGDGTFITFDSYAPDLISGFTPIGIGQIYLYNRVTGVTSIISKGTSGIGGNLFSFYPSISDDANIITFYSNSNNLIPDITTYGNQIFAYNRQTGLTQLISAGISGTGGNGYSMDSRVSGDGSIITFTSIATDLVPGLTTNAMLQVFAYNMSTGLTTLVTKGFYGKGGNGANIKPTINGNGNVITYYSVAPDLIPGITTVGMQVFAYNRATNVTTLVTHGPDGTGGNYPSTFPVVSGNGNIITFYSVASNLIPDFTPIGNWQVYAYVLSVDQPVNPDNNSSNNSNNSISDPLTTNDVNAAYSTSTVGMQETGAPLAGVILSILMIIGGVVGSRKNH